jgi:hypothetical protein
MVTDLEALAVVDKLVLGLVGVVEGKASWLLGLRDTMRWDGMR